MVMRYKIYISLLVLVMSMDLYAQPPGPGGQPDTKHIRIVDTLTAQEKINRNPVILKAELDSLIKEYNAIQLRKPVQEPVKEITDNSNQYILTGLFAIIALLGFIIYIFYHHQQKINRTIAGLNEKAKQQEVGSSNSNGLPVIKEKGSKFKPTPQSLENKINNLNAELHKLSKENEGLNRVIKRI